ILLPMILSLGFDPIWFGIIMTINMEMGLITPPVGLNLYVLKGIAPQVPLKEILIGSMPYVAVLAVAIALFAVFPDVVMFLPRLPYHQLGQTTRYGVPSVISRRLQNMAHAATETRHQPCEAGCGGIAPDPSIAMGPVKYCG